MSSQTDPSAATTPVDQTASTPTSAPAAPASSTDPGYSMSTQISSIAQLQTKAPQVYNAMLQGIASQICQDLKDHQDRINQIIKDGENAAEGKG